MLVFGTDSSPYCSNHLLGPAGGLFPGGCLPSEGWQERIESVLAPREVAAVEDDSPAIQTPMLRLEHG